MQRFSDRTVLVTGAASGIGRAVAQRIAREAGNVFCVDVNSELLQETVGLISAEGLGVAESRVCDVSDPKSVTETVQACVDTFGSLYSIINMAGLLRFDDTEQLLLEDWDHIIAVNLTGTLLFCKAAIPHLLESRGSIVNAASTAAIAGLPCGVAYSASKGGVLAMTRSLAIEYGKRGVRVNCICPGDINTSMSKDAEFPESMDFDLIPRLMSLTGAREPEVVAGVAAMLASEDAAHITGEDIRVDGGTLS